MSIAAHKTANLVALGLTLVTITVYTNSVTDPVNVTKLFVLGGCAFAAIGSIIRKNFLFAYSDRKFELYVCVLFLVVSTGVLFASKSPFSQSYYGAYGRNNGFLLYLLLTFIFIASLSIHENFEFRKYLWAMWAAGLTNMLYAVWVVVFGDFLSWNNPYGNLLGTLGNPNFIGSFFGMFSGLLMVTILSGSTSSRVRLLSFCALPLVILGIYQSNAIQGRVLFVVSAAIVCFYYIYSKTTKNFLITGYIFSLLPFAVLAVLGTLQIGPLKSILYKTSVSLRGEYWHAGWQTGINNPVLGVGFDAFGDWYRRSRRESAMTLPGPETVTNAAHNVFLDMFAFGGFPLLLTYCLINLAVLISVIRFTIHHRKFDPVFVALVTIWLSYQLQSVISINQVGLAIWGWAIGGALVAYAKNSDIDAKRELNNVSKIRRLGNSSIHNSVQFSGVSAGIFAILGFIISAPPLSADIKWGGAQLSQDAKQYEASLQTSFMNPMNSIKVDTTVGIFLSNGLNDLAYKYGLEAIKFNPNSFDAWKNIYLNPISSDDDKKQALDNLKRLDPLNKELENIK